MGGHFKFSRFEIFQDASSPETSQFVLYSNGVAILSGFHDVPQNISVGFTSVIN